MPGNFCGFSKPALYDVGVKEKKVESSSMDFELDEDEEMDSHTEPITAGIQIILTNHSKGTNSINY